ncbi:DUF4393 domain-containing protein [Micromonospora sp. NPDC005686]|uniref:DUF4393 domain-containing protein n=1 Tax=Micromonospora sp. NPDC005686 TaxID=3364233 RepID=UPI003686DDA1
MTGAEIAAAGKAVEIIGRKALDQDKETRDELLQAAQGTPEFKAAARTAAARIAVKERIKLKLYQPFARMIGVSQAYFEDVFPEEMAAKTAHIPDEHLITPAASVAVPAMQGLSYSFDEPDLRELYLNLLTTATDDRRTDDAHPAFAEVIKQLSARETTLLNAVLTQASVSIVKLVNTKEDGGRQNVIKHLMGIHDDANRPLEVPQVPSWVDNWNRLGLVNVSYMEWFSDDRRYDWVTARPEYVRSKQDPTIEHLDIDKGTLTRTAFGERFFRAVSPPSTIDGISTNS